MESLNKWIGKVLFVVMAGALIIYASSRTLDLVNTTLGADNQLVGYLALFATTGGALAWLSVYLWNSKGVAQKSIALVMICVDVVGEIILFTADTLLQSGINGVTYGLTEQDIQIVVYCMSALIAANIAATFGFHIMDVDNQASIEIHLAEAEIGRAVRAAKVAKAQELSAGIAERAAEQYGQELTPDAPVPVLSSLFGDKQSPKAKAGGKQ